MRKITKVELFGMYLSIMRQIDPDVLVSSYEVEEWIEHEIAEGRLILKDGEYYVHSSK